jgi:hypothetical protein
MRYLMRDLKLFRLSRKQLRKNLLQQSKPGKKNDYINMFILFYFM